MFGTIPGVEEAVKTYLALGASGLIVIAFVLSYFYNLVKITPTISKIQTDSTLHQEILKNNTDAIREVAKSNENVATAIKTFDATMQFFIIAHNKHDERTGEINDEILKISERTKRCLSGPGGGNK